MKEIDRTGPEFQSLYAQTQSIRNRSLNALMTCFQNGRDLMGQVEYLPDPTMQEVQLTEPTFLLAGKIMTGQHIEPGSELMMTRRVIERQPEIQAVYSVHIVQPPATMHPRSNGYRLFELSAAKGDMACCHQRGIMGPAHYTQLNGFLVATRYSRKLTAQVADGLTRAIIQEPTVQKCTTRVAPHIATARAAAGRAKGLLSIIR